MKIAFPPIADQASKILILGTMPGERSLELQQYYGNKQNQFWKLLFAITDRPFTNNYEERVALLKEKRVALWDVLSGCEREGSLDSKIRNATANDFDAFYKAHPNITTIFFSSKAAENYYIKMVGKKSGLEYFALPSPSGANASQSFAQKLQKWALINDYID
jgi:hypoxanthine-DNA glycosylase